MSNTKNLELELTPEVSNETFLAWRQKINGETDSNTTKIDEAIGELKANSIKDLGEIGGYPIDDITLLSGWDCIDGVYKFEYEDALGVMGTGTVISSDANGSVSQLLVLSPESGTDCIFYRHFSEADISAGDFWTPLKTKTVNSLTSTSAQDALSAAMGKQLNDQKANEWIATTSGTNIAYTVTLEPAPDSLYVGMTITIIPHTTSANSGATLNVNGLGAKNFRQRGFRTGSLFEATSANFLTEDKPVTLTYDGTYWVIVGYTKPQWSDVQGKPSTFPPSSHKSSGTTYGVGDSGNYGHVKLSDSTTTTSGVSSGVAATPTAVKAAYDLANGKAPKSHASSQPTYGAASENSYGHVKLANNLTTTSTGSALDARQGKALDEAMARKIEFVDFHSWKTENSKLSTPIYNLAATSGYYFAIFAGGFSNTMGYTNVVDAYDKKLVKISPNTLSAARSNLKAASTNNYSIFAGGSNSGESAMDDVDAYSSRLVRTSPTKLSVARKYFGAASNKTYVLFAGGSKDSSYDFLDSVDAYNNSLTKSTPTKLSVARRYIMAAAIGDYLLFAGGHEKTSDSSYRLSDVVDAYNASLVRSTPTKLRTGKDYGAAASTENYAVFGGGGNMSTEGRYVDAYNASLVRTSAASFPKNLNDLSAASVGGYAIFAGGKVYSSGGKESASVYAYNDDLTISVFQDLSLGRQNMAAASIGNYALFGGGSSDGSYYGESLVDIYTTNIEIHIPAYSRYKFQDHTEEQMALYPKTLQYDVPVTGYIKLGGIFNGIY